MSILLSLYIYYNIIPIKRGRRGGKGEIKPTIKVSSANINDFLFVSNILKWQSGLLNKNIRIKNLSKITFLYRNLRFIVD